MILEVVRVCKVLMSINPEHVDNIMSGKKVFEYRKVKCKRKIDSIVIYSTAPVMKIVGEVEVVGLIEGTPEVVWNPTCIGAGLNKNFFDLYYHKKKTAFAYCLGTVNYFKNPLSLSDYGLKNAPQSFVYLN